MADDTPFTLDFANMGLQIARPGDRIDAQHYQLFENMTAFRQDYIQTGWGSALAKPYPGSGSAVLLPSAVHSQAMIDFSETAGVSTFPYQGAGEKLYRNFVEVVSGLSGDGWVSDVYQIYQSAFPWLVVFDSEARYKDNAQILENFGIFKPRDAPTAVSVAAGGLNGDYDWRYVYRNGETQIVGPPSDKSDPQVTLTNEWANVTCRNPATQAPIDTQIDFIDLYRRGGLRPSGWYFSKSVAVTALTTPIVILDDTADEDLGDLLDLNQIEISNEPETDIVSNAIAFHLDRAWINDLDNTARLWFSRRFRVEEFEGTSYLIVGSGANPVIRPIALDDQIFAFTDAGVHRVTGDDENTFRTFPCRAQRGLPQEARNTICKGSGLIFYRAFDGIYALGSSGDSEKISEEVDPLFHRLDTEYLKAIDNDAMADERLEFYDTKLYFAYQDTDGARQELIYDVAMKRWEHTDRPTTSYLRVDRDHVLYSGSSDGYVYQRNTAATNNGVDIVFSFITQDFDFDAKEQDKRFIELLLDVDTDGVVIPVTVFFTNRTSSTIINVQTNSRQIVRLPLNNGFGTYGKNIAFGVNNQSNGGGVIKFYKLTINAWVEPRETLKSSTNWNDYGVQGYKYLRQLIIDLDTQGTSADLEVYVDGDETNPSASFPAISTVNRQRKVLSLPFTIEAKLAKVVARSTSSTDPVKIYATTFDTLLNSIDTTKLQLAWESRGWPGDKRYNQLAIEIDTGGQDVNVNLQIQGQTDQAYTVNTALREMVIQSLRADSIGKLDRVLINSTTITPFRYYSHVPEFTKDPLDVTRLDTYELDFGYQRWKFIRRVWIAGVTQCPVVLTLYVDEMLRWSTKFEIATPTASGWGKIRLRTPDKLKGKFFRFVFTSDEAFKIWLEQSYVSWRPLASERGYQLGPLVKSP